jgi:hypothetical protein
MFDRIKVGGKQQFRITLNLQETWQFPYESEEDAKADAKEMLDKLIEDNISSPTIGSFLVERVD